MGDQMIIRVSHHRNQARNFLNATLSYVNTDFLRYTGHQLDSIVHRSLDLAMVERFFRKRRGILLCKCFMRRVTTLKGNKSH